MKRLTILTILAALGAAGAAAQQATQPAPTMSPEEAAWMKAMTPGAPHARLAEAVGRWEGTVTMWMAPGAPPSANQAVAERTMALGGRVLQERWSGTFNDMPFEGFGMTGYDNVAGRYWSTWNDNMGTGLMVSTGSCDAEHKRCTFNGRYVDPMSGQEKNNRTVLTFVSAHQEKMETFEKGPDGKEWKNMEIVLKRTKKQ